MLGYNKDSKSIEVTKGIVRRTLTYGSHMLLVEFQIQEGAEFPQHAHSYEQIGYLVKGKMTFWIGKDMFAVGPGDSWCIPAGEPHRAVCHEEAIAVDVFSPVRDDYLP
jgi:quercetin dioxygenase-like cupin family protein